MLVGLAMYFKHGINWGIDFAGGANDHAEVQATPFRWTASAPTWPTPRSSSTASRSDNASSSACRS